MHIAALCLAHNWRWPWKIIGQLTEGLVQSLKNHIWWLNWFNQMKVAMAMVNQYLVGGWPTPLKNIM